MRLKIGSLRAREVSIGLEMVGGGGGLLLPPPLPRLNESKSDESEPTGDGESKSGNLLFPVPVE